MDLLRELFAKDDIEKRVWKLLAYAARYGHQPVGELKRLTARELRLLVDQLNELVREENAPAAAGHGSGD